MSDDYQMYDVPPPYEQAIFENGERVPPQTELPRWTGIHEPPAIGTFVQVEFRSLGPSKVLGYFTECNCLGLLVKPYDPPMWFIQKDGYNATCHIFGAEIGAELVAAPVIEGPNLEQLAALQRFANAHERDWKERLADAWMNGSDVREPDGMFLRQVRNAYCIDWLFSKRNPILRREEWESLPWKDRR